MSNLVEKTGMKEMPIGFYHMGKFRMVSLEGAIALRNGLTKCIDELSDRASEVGVEPVVINFLPDIAKQIHLNSKQHGFWDGEAANIPTKLMLIVSEISEAMEAHRKNNFALGNGHIQGVLGWVSDKDFVEHFEKTEKDTFQDELADAVIRILDLAEHYEIDLQAHIKAKHRYNTTREFMHEKKY